MGDESFLFQETFPLLPPAPARVSHTITVLSLGKLLENAEQPTLESKIHALEVKLGKPG